jgi:hypothetical protein
MFKQIQGVKVVTTFVKWDNLDKNVLNGVISVKNIKLWAKN